MNRSLVVFSLEAWDGIWRRNQYLVDGLLRNDPNLRVLFVEPPRDMLHELRTTRATGRAAGLRAAAGYGGRLSLLQPAKVLPRLAGSAADRLLGASVHRAIRRLGMTNAVLWVNDPGWGFFLRRSERPALYDMTDDWLAAKRSPREHERLVQNESILMQRSAAVVVCSAGLRESRREVRPDAVLIQNAVDVARYRAPQMRPADFPGGRTALYVGTLHEDRLDIGITIETARELARIGATLVLVGPDALSATHSDALRSEPGLLLLGPRGYEQIPAYLQHATVLVVPHLVDEFTDSLDPIKLYEYQAVGRPIVSTAVAGFRNLALDRGVRIVRPSDFARTVAEVVEMPGSPTSTTSVPDWSERVTVFGEVVEGMRRTAS